MKSFRNGLYDLFFTSFIVLLFTVSCSNDEKRGPVNEIYVANWQGDSILVFDREADGNTSPLRSISGSATGLDIPVGLSLDLTNDEITVANSDSDSVTVYGRTDNGNIPPRRTISGGLTTLDNLYDVYVLP